MEVSLEVLLQVSWEVSLAGILASYPDEKESNDCGHG